MRITRELAYWPIVAGAICVPVIPVLVAGGSPVSETGYRSEIYRSQRGQIIPLPPGTEAPRWAEYGRSSESLLIYAWAAPPGAEAWTTFGWWLLDRKTGQYRLIHDNYGGQGPWGMALTRLERVRLSQDGRRVAAIRKQYSPEAAQIDHKKQSSFQTMEKWNACLVKHEWVLIDLSDGSERVLKDLSENGGDPSWRPLGFIWLDDARLAFTRSRSAASYYSYPSGIIYTLEVATGEIKETVLEEPGAAIGGFRLVTPGKLLYYLQTAAGLRAAIAHIEKATTRPSSDAGPERQGVSLRLADLTGASPSVRTLPVPADDVSQHPGVLSPDERFYAFLKTSPSQDQLQLTILNLQNGKSISLPDESVELLGWHATEPKLLGALRPTEDPPVDNRGLLVEIPVADVLATLE